MFLGMDGLEEFAQAIRSAAGKVITLGVVPALAAIEAPRAVKVLSEARPDVQVMVFQRNSLGVFNAVQLQQFELGIISNPPCLDRVKVLFRATVPCVCLIPESHKLAQEDGVLDLYEAAEEGPFVSFGEPFDDEISGMDDLLSRRIKRNSSLFAANMPLAASLACAIRALAVVDPFSAELGVRLGGMMCRPLLQSLGYPVALISRGEDTLSREALFLAETLELGIAERLHGQQSPT